MRTRARLLIKSGTGRAVVDCDHFREPMARAIQVVLEEAPPLDGDDLVLTSGKDSHEAGSHPRGDGLDFRGRSIVAPDLTTRRRLGQLWAARSQARLGADYVVLFEEHDPESHDHLHVQHTPRPRARFKPGFFVRIRLAETSGLLP